MVIAKKDVRLVPIAPIVVELDNVATTNALYASGEWGKPRYSEKRDKYVMVRLNVKLKEDS